MQSRRSFLQTSLAVAAASLAGPMGARANPLGLPLGLQLYSVRDYLAKDFSGTLKQLYALGYRQVEGAGFFGLKATEVKQAMQDAGLSCVSAHYASEQLYPHVDEIIEYGRALGLEYIVCSFPAIKHPERLTDRSYEAVSRSFLPEDWHYNAEQFNLIGAKVKQAGMRFAYHNHTAGFAGAEGSTDYDLLMRETDPDKVSFELDCGWVVVAGASPEQVLRRYGSRIHMLHLKDFNAFKANLDGKGPAPVPTEMGRGVIDNKAVLAAARHAAIQHIFVEQEGFDIPWVDSLREDAEWMRRQT